MPVYFVGIHFEERLQYIVDNYGKFNKEKLVNAIIRIKKRLGSLESKNAISYLLENDVKNCFSVLLKYYDKFYLKSLFNQRDKDDEIKKIESPLVDVEKNAALILKTIENIIA